MIYSVSNYRVPLGTYLLLMMAQITQVLLLPTAKLFDAPLLEKPAADVQRVLVEIDVSYHKMIHCSLTHSDLS